MNTRVKLCGTELANPVIPASGTFGYGAEFAALYDINCLGTFSFKGTTRLPRFGNPGPRIAEAPAGLLNSVGLQNPGVDAVIAQDWGFLAAAKAVAPLLRAFAGERLGIHNAAGLEAAAQLGAARVMLPRELTLEDIAALARRSSVELGVTVQGALCSSWEGQCYMASINGRGSANRGDLSLIHI